MPVSLRATRRAPHRPDRSGGAGPVVVLCVRLRPPRSLLAAEALEAGVEALDAAGGVHDALLARVERVRGGRDLDVDHRVGVAIGPLRGLVGVRGGAGEDLLTGGEVVEDDVAVIRVDLRLHGASFVSAA
ncbi:Uncharacterised protein [Streptococcus pneumoniae]|nr:Uncharacterised protein [Streptococcus pneumoniae]